MNHPAHKTEGVNRVKTVRFYPFVFTGERRLKLTGESNRLDVNADFMTTGTLLNTPTLYPSAYLVLTSKGYTKHYYAGADRVAASLGGGGLKAVGSNPGMKERADWLFWESHDRVNGRMLQENDHECIWQGSLPTGEYCKPIDGIPGRMNASVEFYLNDLYDNLKMLAEEQHDEKDVYFYHSDHLGSASWITDAEGESVQHLQYLPFGEPFVNQHLTDYQERYLFTGKERDEETGYGYFGARYMDHELIAMWISVDPMADKYPSISPYAYCAWNPVKLVDPDGNDWYEYTDDKTKEKKIAWTECHSQKQLDKVHKNAKYLGLTADDGKTYYGLMGDQVDKSDKGRYNMVNCLDQAIIKRARRDVNGEGSLDKNQYVDFSNVFTDNNGAAGKQMTRCYDYGGGEATIAMNQRNMQGRFNPELKESVEGNDNQGMGGPGAGVMSVKCPRYEIRQGSGKHSIAGISFYKKPAALARFKRMYTHISSGKILTYSTKKGTNWNTHIF